MVDIDTVCVKKSAATESAVQMMRPEDVVEIVDVLDRAGVCVWLDGGWGVDALLEEQTRPHDDLDCVIGLKDAPAATAALAAVGYHISANELPTRFVVSDVCERRVDFHTVTFGDDGGVQHLQNGTAWRYPSAAFRATGYVAGRPVACISPEVQALAHVGYEPDDKDFHDMKLLAARFGIVLPAPYGANP